jgi:hypothetical protein
MKGRWLLSLLLCLPLSGCVQIPIWRRGKLAHRCMDGDAHPAGSKARQHMLGARESSQGAVGEAGGGCGCN